MKKLISILICLAVILSFAPACGAINKTEVSVLWSDMEDEYLMTIADAFDRAAYIENIKHVDYDADNKAETQLSQVDAAISANASALIVNATDAITAVAILEKAKTANTPIVFLCNGIENDVAIALANSVSSYDKCSIVNVDLESLYKTLGEKIASDLLENYKAYDRNNDGKISYAAFGASALVVPFVNEKLTAQSKPELTANLLHLALPTVAVKTVTEEIFSGYDGSGNEINATPVELILTDDDAYVTDILLALREFELNHKKLVTHFIPLYTVGIAANAGSLIESDNEEELAAYSIMNAIDNGYLSAAALENDDEIALSTAAIIRNLIKGNEKLKDVNTEYVKDGKVLVPYTIY